MNCPFCACDDMAILGCKITDSPFYWCPRCGTIKTCEGDTASPHTPSRSSSTPMGASGLEAVARQWLAARNIIEKSLNEIAPGLDNETNAASIIARLANNEPPLLLCTPDEIRD